MWGDNPDLLWEQLETTYVKLADEICPVKTFNIKKDRPPYFSNKINTAISERESLFSKARKLRTRSQVQSNGLMKKAVLKRKEVKLLIKRAKRKYVLENIESCKANLNKYWRNMTKLLNRKKSSQITTILNNQGKLVKGSEAAEVINNYFCKIGAELANKVSIAKHNFSTCPVVSTFDWGG